MWAVKQKDAFSLGNYICPEIARCLLFYNQQSHFLNKWRLSIILLPTHFSVPRGQTLLFLAQLARLKQSSCCSSWLQEEFGVWSPFACPHLLIWVMACSISRKKKKISESVLLHPMLRVRHFTSSLACMRRLLQPCWSVLLCGLGNGSTLVSGLLVLPAVWWLCRDA